MMNIIVINIQCYDHRIMVGVLDSPCISLGKGYGFVKTFLLATSSDFFL